ncbi:Light regulated Lir1 protein [Dioscorea alata]|uniref:Light regulated Lir1 protein n=1 Tax=Dioscorea alata TaxID=55571 RepID=A0ACB7UTQ0_DIOAL|nr:Light regulated Lir1 protein [Dioscorea alata]
MQAATVCFTGPMPLKSTKTLVPRKSTKTYRTVICPKAVAIAAPDNDTVDYTSSASVFPAEACETIGGTACDVEMFPEVKLQSQPSNAKAKVASTEIDRDYLEYNEP